MSSFFLSRKDIFYFGYGPIVNPMVRSRRGVHLSEEQPAYLEDYRLTFDFGGVVNVIQQRGYEVHGVLMRVDTKEAWKEVSKFDAGYYRIEEVDVRPYAHPDEPIKAYVMVMTNYDESKLRKKSKKKGGVVSKKTNPSTNKNDEKLPQERYLKLIATGMQKYGVDEDYILDQIMGVPFSPSRKREDWRKFQVPAALSADNHGNNASKKLPEISYKEYLKLCRNCSRQEALFLLDKTVVRVTSLDTKNPGFQWCLGHMHGKPDIGLDLHKLIVDPDIPMANSIEELTPLHYEWVEHTTLEFFSSCDGVFITKEYTLLEKEKETSLVLPTTSVDALSDINECGEDNRPAVTHEIKRRGRRPWRLLFCCCLSQNTSCDNTDKEDPSHLRTTYVDDNNDSEKLF